MPTNNKHIVVIGSGISSLSCAAFLAKAGHQVTILEKNEDIGGRARRFSTEEGFVFDMGPSWYWMPDVFERFYNQFGHTTSDFYQLKRLNPSYRVFWGDDTKDDIPTEMVELENYFEKLEAGSSKQLQNFLQDAAYKYQVGMKELVYLPSLSIREFVDWRLLKGIFNLHLFSSFATFIRNYFKHPKLLSLLEFPILFLGATPKNTPALYSLMNYADMQLGTLYPMGGMHEIIKAFKQIAVESGAVILTNHEVIEFEFQKNNVTSVETNQGKIRCDWVVSGADYRYTDLLLKEKANYSSNYWGKRVMAPSSLLFYVGLNKKVDGLKHHNLFFDASFDDHAKEIYEQPSWPKDPLFYVCCPSKTDKSVAPEGSENLFFLIPIAPDLKDDKAMHTHYFNLLIKRIEQRIGESITENITFKRSFCLDDFKQDYHAFKGNAYGLANTLRQTALLKPRIKNRHLDNFYYTGQLTVPGPGVPPSIISGEVVAKEVLKQVKNKLK